MAKKSHALRGGLVCGLAGAGITHLARSRPQVQLALVPPPTAETATDLSTAAGGAAASVATPVDNLLGEITDPTRGDTGVGEPPVVDPLGELPRITGTHDRASTTVRPSVRSSVLDEDSWNAKVRRASSNQASA